MSNRVTAEPSHAENFWWALSRHVMWFYNDSYQPSWCSVSMAVAVVATVFHIKASFFQTNSQTLQSPSSWSYISYELNAVECKILKHMHGPHKLVLKLQEHFLHVTIGAVDTQRCAAASGVNPQPRFGVHSCHFLQQSFYRTGPGFSENSLALL